MISVKQLLLFINLGRVIRPFPNYLESIIERKIIHKWETFKDDCRSWTSQQVHPKVRLCNAQRKCKKTPRATSQTLQASVIMLNVKVHDSTVRKRLNKYGLFGRVAGENLFALKRTWQHSLGL